MGLKVTLRQRDARDTGEADASVDAVFSYAVHHEAPIEVQSIGGTYQAPVIRGLVQVDQTGVIGNVGVFVDGIYLNNRSGSHTPPNRSTTPRWPRCSNACRACRCWRGRGARACRWRAPKASCRWVIAQGVGRKRLHGGRMPDSPCACRRRLFMS
jgi:hypothetical protein